MEVKKNKSKKQMQKKRKKNAADWMPSIYTASAKTDFDGESECPNLLKTLSLLFSLSLSSLPLSLSAPSLPPLFSLSVLAHL